MLMKSILLWEEEGEEGYINIRGEHMQVCYGR
jgi:hypothetical protein